MFMIHNLLYKRVTLCIYVIKELHNSSVWKMYSFCHKNTTLINVTVQVTKQRVFIHYSLAYVCYFHA